MLPCPGSFQIIFLTIKSFLFFVPFLIFFLYTGNNLQYFLNESKDIVPIIYVRSSCRGWSALPWSLFAAFGGVVFFWFIFSVVVLIWGFVRLFVCWGLCFCFPAVVADLCHEPGLKIA